MEKEIGLGKSDDIYYDMSVLDEGQPPEFDLAMNPFSCDCRLGWLAELPRHLHPYKFVLRSTQLHHEKEITEAKNGSNGSGEGEFRTWIYPDLIFRETGGLGPRCRWPEDQEPPEAFIPSRYDFCFFTPQRCLNLEESELNVDELVVPVKFIPKGQRRCPHLSNLSHSSQFRGWNV